MIPSCNKKIFDQAVSVLLSFLASNQIELEEEDEQAIRFTWQNGFRTTLGIDKFEIKIISPRKSGDNVVRIYEEEVFSGRATRAANRAVYRATKYDWYAEEMNRATL